MTQNLELGSDLKGSQIQVCIAIESESYGCKEFICPMIVLSYYRAIELINQLSVFA
jgi:hypothetical protein